MPSMAPPKMQANTTKLTRIEFMSTFANAGKSACVPAVVASSSSRQGSAELVDADSVQHSSYRKVLIPPTGKNVRLLQKFCLRSRRRSLASTTYPQIPTALTAFHQLATGVTQETEQSCGPGILDSRATRKFPCQSVRQPSPGDWHPNQGQRPLS